MLAGARPEVHVDRGRAGPRARLQGRAAGHAVRARRLVALDRQLALFDRLHARQRGAAPDRLLRLLRHRARQHDGHRLRQEPVHAVPVLRAAHALDLSAGHAQAERGGACAPGASISAPARHVARAVPAGDHRDLRARRHARFHAGRHPRRQGRRRRDRAAARALRVRHRQGRGDAAASLAARRDGRADAGQRAAARGRGGEGRRVHVVKVIVYIFGVDTLRADRPVATG